MKMDSKGKGLFQLDLLPSYFALFLFCIDETQVTCLTNHLWIYENPSQYIYKKKELV